MDITSRTFHYEGPRREEEERSENTYSKSEVGVVDDGVDDGEVKRREGKGDEDF
jgi:hypothetical protein